MKFPILLLAASLCACTSAKQTIAYFEPGDHIEDVVVAELRQAKTQVLIQAYGFTSEQIYETIDSLNEAGVDIEVILDKSNESAARSKLKRLKKDKIKTWIDDGPSIAHNKILIIDRETVITGSYNWTEHAKRNAENILVVHDADIASDYADNWYDRKSVSRKPKRRSY